jgi:hypothetical protein
MLLVFSFDEVIILLIIRLLKLILINEKFSTQVLTTLKHWNLISMLGMKEGPNH